MTHEELVAWLIEHFGHGPRIYCPPDHFSGTISELVVVVAQREADALEAALVRFLRTLLKEEDPKAAALAAHTAFARKLRGEE